MLMEEVSCNSGAEEFRVIGDDAEISGQIFNQPTKELSKQLARLYPASKHPVQVVDHPEARVW